MTGNDEIISLRAIDLVRDLHRKLANECHAKGISPEDLALGSLMAAFDITEGAKGEGMVALEHCRSGLDLIERGLLSGGTRR